MTKKPNGADNPDDKLVRFPTPAERDKMREIQEKIKAKQEAEWRRQYKAGRRTSHAPFFNFSKIPPFTGGLIVTLFAVHIGLQTVLPLPALYDVFDNFGFEPATFSGVKPLTWMALASPLTHQFLHGSWVHLLFNSLSLLIMGMFFEKMHDAKTTAFFFLTCGLAGAAVYFLLDPFSGVPIVGASGGISGLFGAVTIILFQNRPQARLSNPGTPKRGPWALIVFWILFMAIMGMASGGGTAWQAHIGGFLAGIGLLYLLQKRKARSKL